MSFQAASTIVSLGEKDVEKLQRLDQDSEIGSLVGELSDWEGWAWYRNQAYWIEAKRVVSLADLNPLWGIHLLLLKSKSKGSVLAVYPAGSPDAHVVLAGSKAYNEDDLQWNKERGVFARIRRIKRSESGKEGQVGIFVVLCSGKSAEGHSLAVVEQVVKNARKWRLSLDGKTELEDFKDLEDLGVDSPMNGLGFCTWSSVGENIRPTKPRLDAVLDSLSKTDPPIPFTTAIIDDGWQSIIEGTNGTARSRGLLAFEEWDGLGQSLKQMVQGCQGALGGKEGVSGKLEVATWMTLEGYWHSISPTSPLIAKYDCKAYPTFAEQIPGSLQKPQVPVFYLPSPDKAYQFWKDYFGYVASCGVTWVKIDNQATYTFLAGVEGGEIHTAMWEGMTRAANETFGWGKVIYCMSHSERMYNGEGALGMATENKKFVIRNSDDFGIKRTANYNHKHIFDNLYQSILATQLCHIPDADMFMTAAQSPLYHALLRAVFPGPLLLSDKKGEHDAVLARKFVARDRAGEFKVLTSKTAARPLARRVFDFTTMDKGPGSALKAATIFKPSHGLPSALIAVWNARDADGESEVKDGITRSDIADALEVDELSDKQEYAIFKCGLGQQERALAVTGAAVADDKQNLFEINLKYETCESVLVAPLLPLGGVKVACLGLVDKFAGLKAVKRVEGRGDRLRYEISHQGRLGVAVFAGRGEQSKIKIQINGKDVELHLDERVKGTEGESLYEVDIPATFDEQASWEVVVSV